MRSKRWVFDKEQWFGRELHKDMSYFWIVAPHGRDKRPDAFDRSLTAREAALYVLVSR